MPEPQLRLQWIETAGGPHLVLPDRYAGDWEGCSLPSGGRIAEATFRCDPSGPATDYDRACSVDGWIGVVPVGKGQALVLTGDITPAAYYRTPRGQHFLLRWVYAESERELLDYFEDVRISAVPESELVWHHAGGKVLLMDSGDHPGHWLMKPVEFILPRGQYRVITFYIKEESSCLIFHELRRSA